ncbi:MAG: hypothetical protein R2710_31645, partial [Acidimicrobiales bacterium]
MTDHQTAHPVSSSRALAAQGGRLAAVLYFVAGVVGLITLPTEAVRFDAVFKTFVATMFVGAAALMAMPWEQHGHLLLRVAAVCTTVAIAVFTNFLTQSPVLLMLPILAAVWCGSVLPVQWMLQQFPIYAVLLGMALSSPDQLGDDGWLVAAGIVTTTVAVGLAASWMRVQVYYANRAMARAQRVEADRAAGELEQRRVAERSTRETVDAVVSSSGTMQGQIDVIAESVERLADAVREIASSSDQTSATVADISELAEHSRQLVAELGESGEQIITVV